MIIALLLLVLVIITAKIWNVQSGRINSVAISSDNRFIVTGSRDKTAILYPVLHIKS